MNRSTDTLAQQMSQATDAQTFAEEWIAAWNERDLDRILSHYADNVVFRSPRIGLITGDATCVVRGIDALRAYWQQAFDRNPDLRFELERVYASKDAITIAYRNHRGQNAAETVVFDGQGLVAEGLAAYAS
jgi:ketosteroid isomerase-like protein